MHTDEASTGQLPSPGNVDIDDPDPFLTDRFSAALGLAYEIHRYHLRKGSGIPYVSHLLAVSAIVLEYGGSEDQAIAALLHDAIEDAGGEPTANRIERSFGDHVVGIIRECSETFVGPKPPWRERKEAYITHLLNDSSEAALLVTLADKTHNAETTLERVRIEGDAVWELFNAPKQDQAWWYSSLASAYEERCPGALTRRFRRAVDELVSSIDRAED